MFKLLCYLSAFSFMLFQPLYAASLENYIRACTANHGNRMGPELCACMGNKGMDLSEEEFDIFYAIAAKDQEKVNKGHTTLDATQKMNVMQLSIMGPSKCASELAEQGNSSDSKTSSENAAVSSSAEAAVEATDSASQ